jgi:hypothetical protein
MLPPYPATRTSKKIDKFDHARLLDGSYQQEALDFFARVVLTYGHTNHRAIFSDIIESHMGDQTVSERDRSFSPFLCMTIALAAPRDIKPVNYIHYQ